MSIYVCLGLHIRYDHRVMFEVAIANINVIFIVKAERKGHIIL